MLYLVYYILYIICYVFYIIYYIQNTAIARELGAFASQGHRGSVGDSGSAMVGEGAVGLEGEGVAREAVHNVARVEAGEEGARAVGPDAHEDAYVKVHEN